MSKIFVAIAAYRDYELPYTINNLVTMAEHPENLTFGICLQYDNDKPDYPEAGSDALRYLNPGINNVAVASYDWRDGKGGCWARQIAQQFYNGEEYTLQVDSHTRCAPLWDKDLKRMVDTYPSMKPLITMCPTHYFRDDPARKDDLKYLQEDRKKIDRSFVNFWAKEGWVDFDQKKDTHTYDHPRKTRMLFGGFVFTYGQWVQEVEQDPQHYYTGEQFALAIRSYTYGYDLYNPDTKVLWHRAHPDGIQSKHFKDFEHSKEYQTACSRLRMLLDGGHDPALGKYGAGHVRSVEDYLNYAGMSWPDRTLSDEAKNGITP